MYIGRQYNVLCAYVKYMYNFVYHMCVYHRVVVVEASADVWCGLLCLSLNVQRLFWRYKDLRI